MVKRRRTRSENSQRGKGNGLRQLVLDLRDEVQALRAAIQSSAAPWPPLADVDYSDAGNANALAREHAGELRYDYARKRWLLFRGQWWQADEDGAALRMARRTVEKSYREAVARGDVKATRWALRSLSPARLNAMLYVGRAHEALSDAGQDWDADPWLLGVANGVVDLRTGKLLPGTPDQKIAMHARAEYNPEAKAPRWEQALAEIFGADEEMIGFVRRAVGYTLTGCVNGPCVVVLWGEGANGKTTIMEALCHVLGQYAAPGGRLRVLPDMDGQRLTTARMARLLDGRRRASPPAPFCPRPPAAWLTANHRPRLPEGVSNHLLVVPFHQRFAGAAADPELSERLKAEAPGILAWAVRGAVEWRKQGLEPPASVARKADPLAGWLADRCEQEQDGQVQAQVGYDDYRAWAEGAGIGQPLSLTGWGRRMGGRFERKSTAKCRFYRHISLKEGPRG